jgi:MinD superfamily P-loop ATPase
VNVDRCHGCGVCALGCRQAAIEMVRLGESIFEAWYQPLPEMPL